MIVVGKHVISRTRRMHLRGAQNFARVCLKTGEKEEVSLVTLWKCTRRCVPIVSRGSVKLGR